MQQSTDLPDLARVLAFYEVARTGSVRVAAKRLGRSQPAISHRLRLLSDELGIEPFERVGRNLVLTPAGRELFGRVERVVVLARETLSPRAVDAGSELGGRVHFGTLPAVSAHLVAAPLARFLEANPRLGVTLTAVLADVLATQLRAGSLDVALFVGARHTESFQLELLGTDHFVAAFSPGLAPSARGVVRPSRLRGLRYLAWGGFGDETFDAAHAWATSARFVIDTTPFIPNIETLRELVARGAGWTLLPSYTVAGDVRARRLVALRPVGLGHEIPFLLARRPGQPESRAVSATIGMLRKAAASLGAH